MKPISLKKLSYTLAAVCLLACFSDAGFAQDKDWRPVTPTELAAKPVVEPDADAEAIFWEVRVDDSSAEELALKHYVRVKIFTERGRDQFSRHDVVFTKGTKVKGCRSTRYQARRHGCFSQAGRCDGARDREGEWR
jgi:hypothetical protein